MGYINENIENIICKKEKYVNERLRSLLGKTVIYEGNEYKIIGYHKNLSYIAINTNIYSKNIRHSNTCVEYIKNDCNFFGWIELHHAI